MNTKTSKLMESSSDAVDAAIARITELLRSPDDLVKTSLIRKRFAIEKASIDAQLKTGVKLQLDTTQEGVDALTNAKKKMLTIRENMKTIDRLCSEAQNMIQDFPRINKISQIHKNFVATQETVQKLQEMYVVVEQIQNMLQQDKQNILGPAENLLFVHYQIFQLQRFRDYTMYQANNSSQEDDVITLKQYFKKLDELVLDFEDYIWNIAKNMIELVRNGRRPVIVKLVKIIEIEERTDERATAAEHARHSYQDLASKFKSIQTSPRVIRSYRSKFKDKLNDSISELFEAFYNEFQNEPMTLLEEMNFIFNDLALVDQEIVPLFPKKYGIFSVFVLAYHRHVYDMLNKLVQSDPDAGTILRLINWIRQYYKKMNKEMRISEDILEPPLLDGNEQDLVNDYLKLIRIRLDEWITNLMSTEISEFTNRVKEPEVGANNLFCLSGSVIMFQMVNQQIDVAAESGQGKILADVVKECSTAMIDTQNTWKSLLVTELKKHIEKPEETQEGFVEYCIALANDQLRCAEFTEDVVKRLEPLLSEKYRNQINDNLRLAMDGFMGISDSCISTLVDVVYNDLKKLFNQFYLEDWYQNTFMLVIIETIKDYANDFQTRMHPYLLNKTMLSLGERFVIANIEAMRNKGAKFKKPDCITRIKNDDTLAFEFFQQVIPAQQYKVIFNALSRIHTLLESSRKTIFIDYYDLKKAYGDVPLKLIEDILSKRDDLDRSQVKEIMENFKAKSKEAGEYTGKPTIFSKIN
ncbi:9778_t:CDS:2 [Entrophospora sp. SA101]|nr:15751_t:CDS:2 [Entrophospora sp. SA101]CAJ0647596.1 6060_t:CDS:2 [Entrophospora sp. SA101]CAJ0754140.1 9778_t:CDS:2 [Entrophospora sp. SA101]CAJ0823964.1 14880_t:CDS:2 [Entrophospora sp. SA101]CAJ0904600.1 5690_t:CDS:2 [Entrophospora sp. SA101]